MRSSIPAVYFEFNIKRNVVLKLSTVVVVFWKDIYCSSDTNRTGAKGLSFYYLRMLYCPDQMLTAILLSQHWVSSSKTIRSRAPCGARCIGHAIRTWSAVSSETPHSQFGEGEDPIYAWINEIVQHRSSCG